MGRFLLHGREEGRTKRTRSTSTTMRKRRRRRQLGTASMQGAWQGTRQAYLQPTTLWKVSSLLFERKTAFKDTTIATVGTLDNLNRIEVFLNEAEFQTQKKQAKEVVVPREKEGLMQGKWGKGVVDQLSHQPQTFPPHHPLCGRGVQVQSGRVRQA